MHVTVSARQWFWQYKYDRRTRVSSPRTRCTSRSTAGRADARGPAAVHRRAGCYNNGVIHSFWIPELNGQEGRRARPPAVPQARGRPARHVPRPVRRVLRPLARRHAAAGDRADRRRLRGLGQASQLHANAARPVLLDGVNAEKWGCRDLPLLRAQESRARSGRTSPTSATAQAFAGDIYDDDSSTTSGEVGVRRARPQADGQPRCSTCRTSRAQGMTKAAGRADREVPAVRTPPPIPQPHPECSADMTTVEDAHALVEAPPRKRPHPRTPARDDGCVELVHDGRPQEDRDHVRRRPRSFFFARRRHRGAVHPPPARAARTARSSQRGPLQRVLHDARHHDGVPHGHADRGRVRQLPRAADDRRAATSRSRASTCSATGCSLFGGVFIYSSFALGGAPDGGWFGYAPLTSTPMSQGYLPGPRSRLLGRRPDHARHRFGRDRGQLHRHHRSTCARPA